VILYTDALPLKFDAIGGMTDEELLKFASENDHIFVERDKHGNIIIMAPTFSEYSKHNAQLLHAVMTWNDTNKIGEVFDSSGGFILPDTSMRAPDVSLVLNEKLNRLSEKEKTGFYKACPDFLIELKSKSDQLKTFQEKMNGYIENGCSFGWLIDIDESKVYDYDKDGSISIHTDFNIPLKGKYFMQKFEINLAETLK
jgi:Uma2 family endonuclease